MGKGPVRFLEGPPCGRICDDWAYGPLRKLQWASLRGLDRRMQSLSSG